jgi:hypothetical protein
VGIVATVGMVSVPWAEDTSWLRGYNEVGL